MIETTDISAQLVLFEDIQTALQPIITDSTISEVIIFNSQIDFESQERYKEFPFVAVDIQIEWIKPEATNGKPNNIIQNFQKGACNIAIHHVFENINNETTAFEEAEPIRHEVYRRLNCLLNENYFTPLLRVESTLDTSHDRVFDYITLFQCDIIESAFESVKETVTGVDLVLTTDLVIENEIIRTSKTEDL